LTVAASTDMGKLQEEGRIGALLATPHPKRQ
jgi:hypothetical protein